MARTNLRNLIDAQDEILDALDALPYSWAPDLWSFVYDHLAAATGRAEAARTQSRQRSERARMPIRLEIDRLLAQRRGLDETDLVNALRHSSTSAIQTIKSEVENYFAKKVEISEPNFAPGLRYGLTQTTT